MGFSANKLGEEWFDEYWINYGSATRVKNGKPVKITTLKDFLEFKGRTALLKKIVTKTKKDEKAAKKVIAKKIYKKKGGKEK